MKRPRYRRIFLTSALGLAAAAPPALEAAAIDAFGSRIARCPGGAMDCGGVASVDLDIGGLRLERAWVHRRGWIARADAVEVRPDLAGVQVHLDGPSLERAPSRPARRAAARHLEPPAPGSGITEPALPDVRVTVAAFGQVDIPDTPMGAVTLRDPAMTWRPGTPIELTGQGVLEHAGARVETVEPLRARIWPDARRKAALATVVRFGDGPPVAVTAEVEGDTIRAELDDGVRGQLHAEASNDGKRLWVRARGFSLDRLDALWPEALSSSRVDPMSAKLDGAMEVVRLGEGLRHLRIHLDAATIEGLRIDHPKLSRDPVVFDALGVSGDIWLDDTTMQTQLVLSHRDAQVHLAATRTGQGIDIEGELPTIGCQALFDAIPEGITGILDGTRLQGEIDGRFSFSVSFDALAAARTGPDGDPDAPPPGSLEVQIEPLKRCAVVSDAPGIDLEGLRGPYRHRFVDDRGRPHVRVMAPGAPGYVPLSSVPRVARAFVTLEDTRFWMHDGFDREQIERALWHNLTVGRVSRGASTITQQAARNLWLGIDRSAGRKLQEALLAMRLEEAIDKERILELYVNIIELGPGIHGIADAAEYHFGKPAPDLEIVEAIHLASMAPAPRGLSDKFASGRVGAAWMEHLHAQVRRMYLHGFISHDEMLRALRAELELRPHEG